MAVVAVSALGRSEASEGPFQAPPEGVAIQRGRTGAGPEHGSKVAETLPREAVVSTWIALRHVTELQLAQVPVVEMRSARREACGLGSLTSGEGSRRCGVRRHRWRAAIEQILHMMGDGKALVAAKGRWTTTGDQGVRTPPI